MDKTELKERREALGMTQVSLAARLGVAPSTVARWEQGVVPIPPYLGLALQGIRREKKQGGDKDAY